MGFDRSPFIPLSEALERPVAGLPGSTLDCDVFRERLDEASASDCCCGFRLGDSGACDELDHTNVL